MDSARSELSSLFHVVAMPYQGRGHINPMMNLCKILASRVPHQQLLVTFIVTEEWLGFIGSEPKPDNIRFATIPNVLPSELVRAADMYSFVKATLSKMEEPFERLLDRVEIEASVSVIIADTFLNWAVDVGNRRNIPVASLWPMSASAFSIFYHLDLLVQKEHFPYNAPERGNELVDYIPGIPSIRLADLPALLDEKNLDQILRVFPNVQKAQYLLFTSIFELESQVLNSLKTKFSFPLYSFGPVIPYSSLGKAEPSCSGKKIEHNYFEWLDKQPPNSVLYMSMGSFLSVSNTQLDEITAGLHESRVRYLWVARGNTSRFRENCSPAGMIVPWCEQLEVLCHPSVGGFWTHCGWSSTMESIFAGVPMLTLPITMDQQPNSKMIVEDWKIGWNVKRKVGGQGLLTKGEIAELVRQFMDSESKERKELLKRAKELQDASRRAVRRGGSSETNIQAFLANLGINSFRT